MNKLSLINRIKYSPLLYDCYYLFGNLIINLLKKIVRCQPNRIVFVSYGGRKYDDSPKAIYEEILRTPFFDTYELIWAFQDPGKINLPRGRKIKIDTLNYFIKLLSARVWVTNSRVERGLNFKGRKTFYLNTWHGTPIKKMGEDICRTNLSFRGKNHWNVTDVMLAQGKYDAEIFSRVFKIPYKKFAIIGLPRNDELIVGNNLDNIKKLKTKIGIPLDKRVILYAPTFREFDKDEGNNCVMTAPLDLDRWSKEFGKTTILLIRTHYEVVRVMNVVENEYIKNVSDYPSLNELMLISDILISDYSSIFFDYSILGRPMIPYCYDYETYSTKRGMYFDIRNELKYKGKSETDLFDELHHIKIEERSLITRRFCSKYISTAGKASKSTVELIEHVLNSSKY